MRKETFRRGTAAYRLAKAQGRLPSQKKAKKKAVQGPKIKKLSSPTAQQAGDKFMATFRKVIKEDKGSTTRTGSPGSTKASQTSNKANNGAGSTTRTGKGKQSRDTKLFKGKFTSRGNRR
jgi:hypothetical protein